ncbi:MAG: hypothetical protein ACREJO_12860, partial [Phycisphaerales bacterium]
MSDPTVRFQSGSGDWLNRASSSEGSSRPVEPARTEPPVVADLASMIDSRLDKRAFRDTHWEGSFFEYLQIAQQHPGVARNAY